MAFLEKLRAAWSARDSLVCVGLDPELSRFPTGIKREPAGILDFNRAIIDATGDLVCAFKPQIAHYAAVGAERELLETIAYIKQRFPEVIVLLDAKRGDIGSTAEMYAREAFDRYGADAVTVNPYLGDDALEPFFARAEKGVFLLCRTSNPGARTFQDLLVDGAPLYQRVAEHAVTHLNARGNLAFVTGATYAEEFGTLRKIAPDVPFLVPGIGAQGGSVEAVLANGQDARGAGLLVSSSRAILYASQGADFASAARAATLALRDEINRQRRR